MKRILNNTILIFMICGVGISCKKLLPTDKDSFSSDTRFTQELYTPVLGRATLYNTFNAGNSTQPLTFKILNPRTHTGEVATELLNVFPVKVWKEAYTGLEKSLEEIENKRVIENHSIFEIRPHSGQFVMWPVENADNFMKVSPDSGYVFDVEVSNSGGRKYFKDFKLRPFRSLPFEPNNANPITGHFVNTPVHPNLLVNVMGDSKDNNSPYNFLFNNDIDITFIKVGNGKSLTLKFLDTLQAPINPNKFNNTNWQKLIHGFDLEKTDTYVKYTVAYPIPLTSMVTEYTNANGSRASIDIAWNRKAMGGDVIRSSMRFDFSIFQEGDWEMHFWFRRANPRFSDD